MLNQTIFLEKYYAQTEEALFFLLKDSFINPGKENWKYGYSFIADLVSDNLVRHRSYRNFNKLNKQIEQATYFTPNTFYRNDERAKSSLRWLNAIFIDIDQNDISVMDILDMCSEAGLPAPSIINKSPKGYHVYFKIEPVWATPKAVGLYNALSEEIRKVLKGDPNAVGGERYIRIPKNIVHFEQVTYTLKEFLDWRDINLGFEVQEQEALDKPLCTIHVLRRGMLNHPAFKQILKGFSKPGLRDRAAFTLALAMKVEGFTKEEALAVLVEWNKKNTKEDKPLNLAKLQSKIRSAYSGKYHGPRADHVREISGMNFYYQTINKKKSREERIYLHLEEIQEDIINFLKKSGGELEISQANLAKEINAPIRSVKKALQALKNDGQVLQDTQGRGRASKTIYKLNEKVVSINSLKTKEKVKNARNKIFTPGQISLEIKANNFTTNLDPPEGELDTG